MHHKLLRGKELWIAIFCVSSAILAACSLVGCVLVVRNAVADAESKARALRSVPSRIESLQESVDGLQTELERLANKVKMQRVRNVTEHQPTARSRPGDEPDPYKNPDEWRTWINDKMARNRHGI